MNIELRGLEQLNAKLKQLADIAEDTMKVELADIALDLAGKCSDAAPVDSGDLRGELANPQKSKDGWVTSWKVGASLPYTRRQHEETSYRHPESGGAKFIEKPFRANVDKYIVEIGNAIESELR